MQSLGCTVELPDKSADGNHNSDANVDTLAALRGIRAKTIIIACSDDLYFPPADNEFEAAHIPNAALRVYDSPWGHCVATPKVDPKFAAFLDGAAGKLLA